MLSFIKGSIIYYAEGEGLTVTKKKTLPSFGSVFMFYL